LVRAVSARFDACLREAKDAKIDVGEARAQHAAYVAALKSLEVEVEAIEPNDEHPDGCFVEDTAVVTGAHALLTVPGATPRQREMLEVLPALKRHCQVHVMSGEARLDGGDVLRVGDVLFVGLSSRTNRKGAEALASVARMDGLETLTIELPTGLHLKSACTLVDPLTIACAPSLRGPARDALRSSRCTLLEMPEELGANVLAVGEVILASASAPLSAAVLRSRGKRVVLLSMTELHKADGALTCLSLRIPRPGHWCV
jgi:dimethylargininase